MTTLAILADMHGSLPALEAVMHDMTQFPLGRVIVAGDIINWGPFSPQVLPEFAKVDAWRYIPAPYHVRRVPDDN